MKNKSPNLFIDPHPDEWLTSDRLEFLRNSISPLFPLLQESNLFDKLLSTWIKHEIIKEKTSQDSFNSADGQAAAGTEPGTPGDPNAPKPGAGGAGAPAGGQAGAGGIPANIQKAIDSLDANGKKELAALL